MADVRGEGCSMKNFVLFLALLLSACANHHRASGEIGGATNAAPGHQKNVAEPQPVARQRPVLIEKQQPARSAQENSPPKKHEHNVEED